MLENHNSLSDTNTFSQRIVWEGVCVLLWFNTAKPILASNTGLKQRARGGMRKTERVSEMKHPGGQGSSHPESSPRARSLCGLGRSDKQSGVCSPPVNDWLNKWTDSLWCCPPRPAHWLPERTWLLSEWLWWETHTRTAGTSQGSWGDLTFNTCSRHNLLVIPHTCLCAERNTQTH